ncbi:DUF1771-domain-containing protein [Nemania sp. FL0916]|nr:DUF1771-domain-containing protein [Nemania sp. FL0916]
MTRDIDHHIDTERYREHRVHGRLGGSTFNHSPSAGDEAEHKRLSDLADEEYGLRRDCMERSHSAYQRGDKAGAKQLSNEGKAHGAKAEKWEKQASDFIFQVNNAKERVAPDEIDLHGQHVDEALYHLIKRIEDEQKQGHTHLHVIVGKGIHSVNHIQRLKPAVEELCDKRGLRYETEENEGRVYLYLPQRTSAHVPSSPQYPAQHGGYADHAHGGNQQQYHPGQQQQHHGGQNQQEQQEEEIEKLVTKLFQKFCCVVM